MNERPLSHLLLGSCDPVCVELQARHCALVCCDCNRWLHRSLQNDKVQVSRQANKHAELKRRPQVGA